MFALELHSPSQNQILPVKAVDAPNLDKGIHSISNLFSNVLRANDDEIKAQNCLNFNQSFEFLCMYQEYFKRSAASTLAPGSSAFIIYILLNLNSWSRLIS